MQGNRTVRGVLGLLLAVAMLVSILPSLVLPVATAAATTWYVDDSGGADFTTISAAVVGATAGDTIIVRDGAYAENVMVDRSLVIRSENGAAAVTVTAVTTASPVFTVSAGSVTIDGFTVTGTTSTSVGGIEVSNVDSCLIANNSVTACGVGIRLGGTANNNTVTGNNCYGNTKYGFAIRNSAYDNFVSKNTFSSNATKDICIKDTSTNNTIWLNDVLSSGVEILTTVVGHSPTEITYTYGGATYTGYLGNYYSTYAGCDADGNGVGDTAFTSSTYTDSYPLMAQYAGGSYVEVVPSLVPDADFSASIPQGQIVNGDFETGALDPWTASVVAPYGDTPGVQLVTSGSSKKGTTGIRIWRTPVNGGNIWIEQEGVDLTNVEWIRLWRKQYGVSSSQELSVLVDNTTVAVFNESTSTTRYDIIDLSSFDFSGLHTLKIDAYNGHATAAFSIYLDDIAAFGPSTSGLGPLTVIFKDLSSNSPTSWAWDFNNDGVSDSTEQNPIYTYTAAGTYTVKLTATNADGSGEEVKSDYITVNGPPVAAFTSDVQSGSAPLTVHFTDQSTGVPTSWAWDFDNDGTVDSHEENPTFTYNAAGTYTVKLTVTNAYGADDEVKTGYIAVALPTYVIMATAGDNGTIDPSGTVVVTEGDNMTFTISPAAGFHVADVLVDGASVGAVTSYEFTSVTVDHTIWVTFAADAPAWDLNGDHVCNIGDVVVVGLHWGETGAPNWIPQDLNSDGVINIGDVVILGLHWGETW